MPDIRSAVQEFFLDVLAGFGLAFTGGPAAAAGELLELQQASFEDHPNAVLSPEQLATAVVKGAVGADWAVGQARKSGLTEGNFETLTRFTGNPPGPATLLDMLNRGIIDASRFDEGVKQGLIKSEWIFELQHLRRTLLSLGEIVAAVVQNQTSQDDGAQRAAQLGYDASDFDLAVRTAGNPPGPMQALEMWRRGIISEDQFAQVLRESRYKNKYIPAFIEMFRRRLPMRTITTLLNHGAIDDAKAEADLAALGYNADDARALIASGRFTRTKATRDLSVAQVRTLYTERVMTRDTAVQALLRVGYSQDVADEILSLADVEADHKIQTHAIGAIRTRYVSRRIEQSEASNALDGIGVPHDQRDHLLSAWSYEREANVAHLTLAQVTSAAKKGVITTDEWFARVVAMGYSAADTAILAAVDGFQPGK